jgi:hypothetical protein
MRIWLRLAAVSFALQVGVAWADRDPLSGAPLPPGTQPTPSPITDHFYLGVEFFDPGFNTSLRIDPTQPSPVTSGTPLNGEHDLGFPGHQQQARVEAMMRMRERNRIRVDYFESNRNGSVTLANPIIFGNQVFAAGSQLQSSLDWRLITVTYLFSLYRSDRLEIGTGIASYSVQLTAEAQVPVTFQQETATASGTIPALPLDLTWRVSRRVSLTARGAYFRAAYKDFRGELNDLHADAQFRWLPNLTSGVGYALTRASLTRNEMSSSPGMVSMTVSGPEVFVRFSF